MEIIYFFVGGIAIVLAILARRKRLRALRESRDLAAWSTQRYMSEVVQQQAEGRVQRERSAAQKTQDFGNAYGGGLGNLELNEDLLRSTPLSYSSPVFDPPSEPRFEGGESGGGGGGASWDSGSSDSGGGGDSGGDGGGGGGGD